MSRGKPPKSGFGCIFGCTRELTACHSESTLTPMCPTHEGVTQCRRSTKRRPLNHHRPHGQPEPVLERLVEAYQTDRRLPGDRPHRVGSAWPAAPIHSWQDKVHWSGAEERERVWRSWERAPAIGASEVSRMEESFAWLRRVPAVEREVLEAWASTVARNLSVSAMIGKRGLKRSSFYRHRDRGAQRIARSAERAGRHWTLNPARRGG